MKKVPLDDLGSWSRDQLIEALTSAADYADNATEMLHAAVRLGKAQELSKVVAYRQLAANAEMLSRAQSLRVVWTPATYAENLALIEQQLRTAAELNATDVPQVTWPDLTAYPISGNTDARK